MGVAKKEAKMITLIEALNYRCLRYVSRSLGPFHVLVGPNASGKTTFLDVVGFLQDLVSEGLDVAISNRTRNPQDLLFLRLGQGFELALEARIPDGLRQRTARPELDTARYESGGRFRRNAATVRAEGREVSAQGHPAGGTTTAVVVSNVACGS